jgi:DNA-binding NarL/FixJ family response regulator
MSKGIDLRFEERAPSHVDAPTTAVLRLADPILRMAASGVLREAGFRELTVDDGEAVIVTDDHGFQSERTILVIGKSSGAAQAAVRSALTRKIAGVIMRDDAANLPVAIASWHQDIACISQRVLESANSGPEMTEREILIIARIAKGETNARIAARLGLSPATIKRQVSALLHEFGCETRLELALKLNQSN